MIVLILILIASDISAKYPDSRIKVFEKKIETLILENDSIKKQIKEYKKVADYNSKLLETQLSVISNTNSNISNQISSTSNFISIAGLILGFFGLFIGGYVTWMQNKSSKILKKSKDILNEINVSKKEVIEIQELIDSNMNGLYSKIKEQEVEYILRRIEKIPEDINHVFPILASREISDRFFDRFKPLIINESKKENKNKELIENLLTLSCQHFPFLVINDIEILTLLLDCPSNLIDNFYDIELDEFLVVFINQIQTIGLYKSIDNIVKLLKLINSRSSIESFTETIFNTLYNKQNRFEFCRIIKDLQIIQNIKMTYFNLLVSNYENDNNSENDNLLINEIKK